MDPGERVATWLLVILGSLYVYLYAVVIYEGFFLPRSL